MLLNLVILVKVIEEPVKTLILSLVVILCIILFHFVGPRVVNLFRVIFYASIVNEWRVLNQLRYLLLIQASEQILFSLFNSELEIWVLLS